MSAANSDLSVLSNEVLRLLCSQNSLILTGGREDMMERLANCEASGSSTGTRTRSGEPMATNSSSKRPRLDLLSAPDLSDNSEEIAPQNICRSIEEDGAGPSRLSIAEDVSAPVVKEIRNNMQLQEQPTARSGFDTVALATLISTMVDKKLKTFQHSQPGPSQQAVQSNLRQQLADPLFASALLSQPSSQCYDPTPFSQSAESSLTSHVSQKTKQAILRGEYIEFDSLLPENTCSSDSEFPGVSISFDGQQHYNIPAPPRKRKAQIDSIDKWISAFSVFCSVFLNRYPNRAVEMFSYLDIIRSAQRKFSGFAWLSYDIDFRKKAASNLSLNWGERDLQLFLLKFTGQAKSCCSICGSGDHYSYGCPFSPPRVNSQRSVCFNFNRGSICSQVPCPFAHRCKSCNGEHPFFRHEDVTSKARSHADKKPSHR